MKLLLMALTITWAGAAESGLETIKAEVNLERRSELALAYAGEVLTKLRPGLETKEWAAIAPEIEEFRAAVDLSFAALKATGKNARKSPKYFKRAELKLRELSRRLRGLQVLAAVEDRPKMDEVIAYVDKLQDELVEMTMGVRK
ncbi:MAG: hypothetical protein B7X34_08025 [Acidobacteriia bacterium 12-62-4]|nr:MAG: hypothetical protein B7X34_08025 [Acidobacteriia bacterium 12-62-4]